MSSALVVVVVVLACVLLIPPIAPGRAAAVSDPIRTADAAPRVPAVNLSLPALTVSPDSWWTGGGRSTPLNATWTDAPPGCTLSPGWFRWSLPDSAPIGVLSSEVSPTTNFTAAVTQEGTGQLAVTSAATVECGPDEATVVRAANATVVVDPALEIQNVSASPDPILDGANTTLVGELVGGTAPYSLRVGWGDGASTLVNLSGDGAFAVAHEYSDGKFRPTVEATDADGLVAVATAPEPIAVGDGPEVGLSASTYLAEVGVPVQFAGTVLNGPAGSSTLDACIGPAIAPPATGASSGRFSCTFPASGVANVTFRLNEYPWSGPLLAATTLAEPVAAPLSVSVAPVGAAEVGAPTEVAVDLSGGVPPFTVTGEVVGAPSPRPWSIPGDGTFLFPVESPTAGDVVVSVDAVDALGVTASGVSPLIPVDDPLAASAAVAAATTGNGTWVELSGGVTAGPGPFDWAVAPTVLLENLTSPPSVLNSTGGLAWSARLVDSAPLVLTLVVVDATGRTWTTSEPVPLAPPLSLVADVIPAAGGTVRAAVSIGGGSPPVALWVNFSNGDRWNASGLQDGAYSWTLSVAGSGEVVAALVVVDRLGEVAYANVTPIVLVPSTPVPSSNAAATWAVGGFVALLAIVAALAWRERRRRRAAPAPPPPDAPAILRKIIEPADGVDRGTVELLAEEQGVTLEIARTTLDGWIADGTLRAERGSDGEEVLAWDRP